MVLKKILPVIIFITSFNFCFSQQKKVSVYAFVAEDCPISIFMAPSLKSIADQYGSNVDFYLVFPFSTSTAKSASSFKRKNKLTGFTTKVDTDQSITKKLGATITPEVVIIGADDSVLYRGRINDAYTEPGKRKHIYTKNDLATALQIIINGNEVPKPWKRAVGCFITKENESL